MQSGIESTPIGTRISLLSAHRRVNKGVCTRFSMILPFKIPVFHKLWGGEYNVDYESVTTLLHLHLEFFAINDYLFMFYVCVVRLSTLF